MRLERQSHLNKEKEHVLFLFLSLEGAGVL